MEDKDEIFTEHEEKHLTVSNLTLARLYEVLANHAEENARFIDGSSRCARMSELHAISALAGQVAVAICEEDASEDAGEIMNLVISQIKHEFMPEDAIVN